ncbi:MAG: HNH endonuclease [Thermoflexales bacterium]|nr:HNH endonuclease [Thermoflexales bacterium]MCS7325187.1 HNH endonuclease [Thermoflexales bacterium]MDW8053386.1 HNH endonuclease [Anaerolineae bacterium]MDW8292040.1 HNH endonuclease [Anaerolineae bacterium]
MRRVLVLNATYEPLSVVSVPRALHLVMARRAEVLETSDVVLRSAQHVIPVPLVIRLLHYVRVPHNLPLPLSRKALLLRDNYTCQYCGAQPSRDQLTIDHVVPRSRGGRTEWENVVIACATCNRRKGNRTPEEAGMKLLRKPYRPRFWAMALLNMATHEAWRKYLANGDAR